MSDDEQRVHARIHVSTSVDVVSGSGQRVEAVLRDLSKGGARFLCAQAVGKPGECIQLSLPSLAGPDLRVVAEIIRACEQKEGVMVAVRFDEIAEEMRPQLHDLIEVLLSTSAKKGKPYPRATRRMEVRFGQLEELRAILSDLTEGALSMTVESPLVLYEELELNVPDASGSSLLILQARVIEQRAIATEGTYRVRLEVGPLRAEAKGCLDAILKVVSELTEDVTASPG